MSLHAPETTPAFPRHRMLIVGLGLLGGSAAMAARERELTSEIVALARRGHPHDEAVRRGIVDRYTFDLKEGVSECDFILLCQPVDKIRQCLPDVMAAARPGTIVTDVGSTKWGLVEAAEKLRSRGSFVGSHPMVGGHVTGWQHGREELFEGGTIYVTPTENTDLAAAAKVAEFWENLGGNVVMTHPQRHDQLAALLSHLPHMTAVALMEVLCHSGEDPHFLRELAGTGLRDTTRVAMGSVQMWCEIAGQNAEPIAAQLDQVAARVQRIAAVIRQGNMPDLEKLLKEASNLRTKMQR